MSHCFYHFQRVRSEHIQASIFAPDGDQFAIRRILTRSNRLAQHFASQQTPLLGLYAPNSDCLVIADRAAFEPGRMRTQTPQFAFAMTLYHNAHHSIFVYVNYFAIFGADKNFFCRQTYRSHRWIVTQKNTSGLFGQRRLVQVVLVNLIELCIPEHY
ncbi:hypothetical protein BpHYR1_040825 [Brachionus plicatilis]|uniref:Uncharacterized protein n=1 Tax=Brachionus plicatilis TaxID=10195 RepID=A0A3M7RZT5_BRAPC|nr:hypothetical protein BpHYR1_040825 [Brachionus plicatilis]